MITPIYLDKKDIDTLYTKKDFIWYKTNSYLDMVKKGFTEIYEAHDLNIIGSDSFFVVNLAQNSSIKLEFSALRKSKFKIISSNGIEFNTINNRLFYLLKYGYIKDYKLLDNSIWEIELNRNEKYEMLKIKVELYLSLSKEK